MEKSFTQNSSLSFPFVGLRRGFCFVIGATVHCYCLLLVIVLVWCFEIYASFSSGEAKMLKPCQYALHLFMSLDYLDQCTLESLGEIA